MRAAHAGWPQIAHQKLSSVNVLPTSVIGGKADMARTCQDVRY